MTDLEFDAVAMATVEGGGRKTWIVHAKRDGKTFKLRINVGEHQMAQIEREEPALAAPCA